MADRFWVAGSGNWSDATNHWATSSGGAPGAGNLPTSADDVFFDSASHTTDYTVTIDATTKLMRDLTFAAPASGNVTWAGSVAMTVSGSMTLYAGLVRTYTGAITFNATTTGKTITSAGVTLANNITFNGVGGGWIFNDDFKTNGSFTLTGGALDLNGKTIWENGGGIGSSFGSTRSIVFGTGTLKSAGGISLGLISTGLTISCASGTLDLSLLSNGNTNANIGNHTFGTCLCGGFGGVRFGNNSDTTPTTFGALTITGSATKTNSIELYSNIVVTGTFTLNGNSSINRYLIKNQVFATAGTQRTITAGTVVVTNADFQDIVGAGAGSWNLSAITGGSGDCGGNSGITFTTPATQYWFTSTTGSKTWSTAGNWFLGTGGTGGAGRVPLPQDTARFDASSIGAASTTITHDMPRFGSLDFTGVTNTPTFTQSVSYSFFGSIILSSGITLPNSAATKTYEGRGSATLISAGLNWNNSALAINCVNGTLTLGDAYAHGNVGFVLSSGTFDADGFNVSVQQVTSSGTASKTLNMGSGTWTANISFTSSSGLTVNAETSTVRATGTFFGGGGSYNRVEFYTASSQFFRFFGATINEFYIDASAGAKIVSFQEGLTYNIGQFTRDAGTNVITIRSLDFNGGTATSSHNLVKTGGGVVPLNYMSVSRSTATPSNTWYAGNNNTDGGNNSGWLFTGAPSGGMFMFL